MLSETNPVRGVNFDVIFQDEDLVTEGRRWTARIRNILPYIP